MSKFSDNNRVHSLKTVQPYFNDVASGAKKFEVRHDDRNFQVNDVLILKEYDPKNHTCTGKILVAKVTYILRDYTFGMLPDHVVMGIQVLF
jgi:hypothetical protein